MLQVEAACSPSNTGPASFLSCTDWREEHGCAGLWPPHASTAARRAAGGGCRARLKTGHARWASGWRVVCSTDARHSHVYYGLLVRPAELQTVVKLSAIAPLPTVPPSHPACSLQLRDHAVRGQHTGPAGPGGLDQVGGGWWWGGVWQGGGEVGRLNCNQTLSGACYCALCIASSPKPTRSYPHPHPLHSRQDARAEAVPPERTDPAAGGAAVHRCPPGMPRPLHFMHACSVIVSISDPLLTMPTDDLACPRSLQRTCFPISSMVVCHCQVVEAVNVPRTDWFGGRADPFVR